MITSIGYISLYLRDKRYKLALTGVAVSPGSKKLYTAAKDARIFVWDLERGAKLSEESALGGQHSECSLKSTKRRSPSVTETQDTFLSVKPFSDGKPEEMV